MPLPFKDDNIHLPNNKALALERLHQLKRRLQRDINYREDYLSFMNDLFEKGYATEVPPSELESDEGHVWYIPHHGVYHPKKPGKIRVVFDCSARYKGQSLNDRLLEGPNLTNLLIGVLCRFRQEPIAFICDVEAMFHQFKVNKEHRSFLRFLWWDKGDFDNEPMEYHMNVHLFGASSSPGCANYGLKQIASDCEAQYGTPVMNFIHHNFYVDDGLKSVSKVQEAVSLIKNARDVCATGGLRLHKFISNSKEVMKSIPSVDRAKGVQDFELWQGPLPVEKALGAQWCIESDSFSFRITLKDKPFTRRGILATVNSVYDPLGFIAPVILVGKIILQDMCRDHADWDDILPDSLKSRWEKWRNSLFHLGTLHVNRCFKPPNFGEVKEAQLHHFSDASLDGYGQCSYLRILNESQEVHCSLVIGKARVAPLKSITIPRLELTAALVSIKMSTLLHDELEYETISDIFWTDSRVVLGYIANDSRRFHIFVANRVQQIRDHSNVSQWHYVTTKENPADEGSRGLSAEDFIEKSKWIQGPDFLWQSELPLENELPTTDSVLADDPELKKSRVLLAQQPPDKGFDTSRLDHFSDWFRAKRAIAVCLRLKSRFQKHEVNLSQGPGTYVPVNVNDLKMAEAEIIKMVQKEAFATEIRMISSFTESTERLKVRTRNASLKRSSTLFRLDPFLDQNGILRVGGRVRRLGLSAGMTHPVILPRKSHISELIIAHCHNEISHQGRGMTISNIRRHGFWIIGCSSAVSSYIHRCVKCRKLRGQVQNQKMADLPVERLTPSPPFTYCGVDFFGPWIVREGRKSLKRYGALFTCLVSRAVHVEVATSLSTDAFMNTLRRFLSIRGPIRQLRCDCGTNFVGANNELKDEFSKMDETSIKKYLLTKNCDFFEFRFNVPSASHMGGAWERQIRTIRSVLSSLMDQASGILDDDSLRTLMYEATSIVNSRPLTTQNLNDPESLLPLTPNHLLTLKSDLLLPPPGNFDSLDLYARKRWRRVQHLANQFWQRWRKEYLHNLQIRSKWVRPTYNMKVNDVVIIKDDDLPRNRWLLGRVVDTFPSDDNRVRSVKVMIASQSLGNNGKRKGPMSYLTRPIHKLILLLES